MWKQSLSPNYKDNKKNRDHKYSIKICKISKCSKVQDLMRKGKMVGLDVQKVGWRVQTSLSI